MRWRRHDRPVADLEAADEALKAAQRAHADTDATVADLQPEIARLKDNAEKNHLYESVIRAWLGAS